MKEYHGMSKTRLYRIWNNMKNRCTNNKKPDYKYYGGRGISFCKEWLSFSCFYDWAISNGYNDTLTLDRINVNGNYCPENCRFVSGDVQSRNKRNNLYYNGVLICEIAKDRKEYMFLSDRIRAGIPLERPKRILKCNITVNGQSHNLREWSRILGINSGTLHYHLKKHGTQYIEKNMGC